MVDTPKITVRISVVDTLPSVGETIVNILE